MTAFAAGQGISNLYDRVFEATKVEVEETLVPLENVLEEYTDQEDAAALVEWGDVEGTEKSRGVAHLFEWRI